MEKTSEKALQDVLSAAFLTSSSLVCLQLITPKIPFLTPILIIQHTLKECRKSN